MNLESTKIDFSKLKKNNQINYYTVEVNERETEVAGASVSAGFPAYTENFKTEPISIDKFLIAHPESTFIIKVDGNSMQDAGIVDNSFVIVDTSRTAKTNDIIIARLDDEFLMKRLIIENDYVVLKAENQSMNYKDLIIDNTQNFEVWGVVTGVFFKVS